MKTNTLSGIKQLVEEEERKRLLIMGNWNTDRDIVPDYQKIDQLLQEFVTEPYLHVARQISGARLGKFSTNPFESNIPRTFYKPEVRLMTGGGVTGPGEEHITLSCKVTGMSPSEVICELVPHTKSWYESDVISLLSYLSENCQILYEKQKGDMLVEMKVIVGSVHVDYSKAYLERVDPPKQFLYSKQIKIGEDICLNLGHGRCPDSYGAYAASFCNGVHPNGRWVELSTKHDSVLIHGNGALGFSRPEDVQAVFPGDKFQPVVPDLVRMLFPEAKFFIDGEVDKGYPTFENYFTHRVYDTKIKMRQ